jgi:signal peptidase II
VSGSTTGNLARPLLLGLGVAALDQITKRIVSGGMIRGESIPVLGNFFRLTFVQNPGGAFGLFRDSGSVFTVLSLVAVVFLFWTVHRYPAHLTGMRVALGLVLGGAVGNLIDRIRMHRVVDFFDVGFGDLRWPVFNVADVAVVLGVVMFLIVSIRSGDSDDQDARTTVGGDEAVDRSGRGGTGEA